MINNRWHTSSRTWDIIRTHEFDWCASTSFSSLFYSTCLCVCMCLYLFLFFNLWRLRLFIIIQYNVRNKASRGNKQLRIIFVLIAVIFIVHAIPSRLWLGVLLYVYYWLSIRVTIYSSIKMISTISMILQCVFVCTLCRFYFDIFYSLLSKYRKYAIRSVRKICRCNVITIELVFFGVKSLSYLCSELNL